MSEATFPYSPLGQEPFQLRGRIDTVYHGLRRKFENLDGMDDWTFDAIIDDVAEGIRQNQINALFFEQWLRFPFNEPPSSFNAFRIAVAFWLEAHYAHKAGDFPQSTAALFQAYFYAGMVEAPRTVTEVAIKGGISISDRYRALEQAAIAAADKQVTQGGKRDQLHAQLTTKGIIPFIANDPVLITANESLGESSVSDLTVTLTRWTRTDQGGRPKFRDAYFRVKHAWKDVRKVKKSITQS